ncbi:MAG: phytanoyl-CoA dioxygenase family protein [Sandaracinaceae bacterium]
MATPRGEDEHRARDLLPGVPLVESPLFDALSPSLDPETRAVAEQLRERGFAVVDFPDRDFDAVAQRQIEHLGPRFDWDEWRAHGHAAHAGLRLDDAWTVDEDARRIAANKGMIDLLSRLYGRPAFPFQTLTFPVGTQQHLHTDAVYFHSVPERFMCGVWVALEDIHEDAGPLEYCPGSHRFPVYTNEHLGRCAAGEGEVISQSDYEPLWRALIDAHGLHTERFMARKGQALIWTANLLHGGAAQRDPARTRWSQVTHYFFEGCVYYYPMRSDPMFGSIEFLHPVDIRTGEPVPAAYAGRPLAQDFVRQVTAQPPELPTGFDAALYLEANPDVAEARVDPAQHWLTHGKREGRKLRP